MRIFNGDHGAGIKNGDQIQKMFWGQSQLDFVIQEHPPPSVEDMFQHPRWMPETSDTTESYPCFSPYIPTPDEVELMNQAGKRQTNSVSKEMDQ